MGRSKERVQVPKPCAEAESDVCVKLPPVPQSASTHAAPRVTPPLKDLSSIRNESHVRVSVHDLVAYEYVDAHDGWQWGLATVAALPAPRLVQLVRWRPDAPNRRAPPPASPVALADPQRAAERIAQLRAQRERLRAETDTLRLTLTTQRAEHAATRRRLAAEATAAEQTLHEARRRLREMDAADWREIRSYRTPPPIVVLVMEAVLAVLGERVVVWSHVQNVIRAPEFMSRVERFDPMGLGEETKCLVRRRFLSNPKFTYADAMNGSRALGYLHSWVTAQVATSSAAEGLQMYDETHATQRAALSEVEAHIADFQVALRRYQSEEDELRALMRGADAPQEENAQHEHTNGTAGPNSPTHHILPDAESANGSVEHSPQTAAAPISTCHLFGAKDAHADCAHRAIWTYTEELLVTLRSAVLCNYDAPETTVLRLTSEQITQIEDALRRRGNAWEEEQRAESARRETQRVLEDLRGQHGHAMRRLRDAESRAFDLQNTLTARERELERLNHIIHDNHIPLCPLPWRTPRPTPNPTNDNTQTETFLLPNDNMNIRDTQNDAGADGLGDGEDALRQNPTATEMRLLHEDLCAAQEETRRAKAELDHFRHAMAPTHYTSAALGAEMAQSPEAQLTAAASYCKALEAQLEQSAANALVWREVMERIRAEAERQQREAGVTGKVLEEVHHILGPIA